MQKLLTAGLKTFFVVSAFVLSVSASAKSKPLAKNRTTSHSEATQIVNLSFLPDSRIQLNGDSTFKKYSAVTSHLDLSGEAKLTENSAARLPWAPIEVEMLLAVKNLKSGDETLDKHMYENLKAEKFPQIHLKLATFNFSDSRDGKPESVTASGTLMVAGVTKPLELKINLMIEGQKLRITGNKKLLMSDYDIDPPTMMLGAMKTRNEVEINFNVICLINYKEKEQK